MDTRDCEHFRNIEGGYGKNPVAVSGSILSGALTLREEVMQCLKQSRGAVVKVVEDYSSEDEAFLPEEWRVWYPKTQVLLGEIDNALTQDT